MGKLQPTPDFAEYLDEDMKDLEQTLVNVAEAIRVKGNQDMARDRATQMITTLNEEVNIRMRHELDALKAVLKDCGEAFDWVAPKFNLVDADCNDIIDENLVDNIVY